MLRSGEFVNTCIWVPIFTISSYCKLTNFLICIGFIYSSQQGGGILILVRAYFLIHLRLCSAFVFYRGARGALKVILQEVGVIYI